MVVLHDLIHSFKCSSRFLLEELKYLLLLASRGAHSFNSSGGIALFVSSSAISFGEVHVLFFPCSVRVLPKFFRPYSFSYLTLTGVVS